jgi:hypothetical protein
MVLWNKLHHTVPHIRELRIVFLICAGMGGAAFILVLVASILTPAKKPVTAQPNVETGGASEPQSKVSIKLRIRRFCRLANAWCNSVGLLLLFCTVLSLLWIVHSAAAV